MHNDRVKGVLNKIDYSLKEIFENVEIKRLKDKKEPTFEARVSGVKNAPKNSFSNKAELVILMTESEIFDGSVIWKYKSNPLLENSMVITRTSTVGSMAMDVEDIIKENRFSKEYLETLLESVNESSSYIDDKSPVKVMVTGDYSRDNAERLIDNLDETFNIGASYVDTTDEGVILELYPYEDYDGSREDFENFVNSHEAFYKIDENRGFEFNYDEEVIVEGVKGNIIDRERLEVGDIKYNVYQVYLEGKQERVFEYDINKK